jgi:hypothetical protein
MTSQTAPNFPKLGEHNYSSWSGDMAAYLKRCGLWFFATSATKEPSFPSPISAEQQEKIEALQLKKLSAASEIWLMVEDA